jgi:hypothetical protein
VSRHPWLAWPLIPAKKAARLLLGDTHRVIRSGNWHGNDTCWRMVLDLNKCLFGFGGDGLVLAAPRRYLAVVDGIVGGEGNGPMAPDPVASGAILAGTHPLAVDCAAAALMGFDWTRIPLLREAFHLRPPSFVPFTADQIVAVSAHGPWNGPLERMQDTLRFRPHLGWVGAIERGDAP